MASYMAAALGDSLGAQTEFFKYDDTHTRVLYANGFED